MSQVSNVIQLLRLDAEPSQVSVSPDAWDDLAVAAIALGFAPLLHAKTQGIDLPSGARAKLAVTYAATQRRNSAIASQLAELLAAYAAAGIDAMVLKGGYLAFAVYPDPALRGMSDLDLFFRPDDLGRAEAVLQSLGYQGKHKSADEGPGIVKHTSTYKREASGEAASTPNPYLSTSGDRHVDPHGSLEESWFGLQRQRHPWRLGTQPAGDTGRFTCARHGDGRSAPAIECASRLPPLDGQAQLGAAIRHCYHRPGAADRLDDPAGSQSRAPRRAVSLRSAAPGQADLRSAFTRWGLDPVADRHACRIGPPHPSYGSLGRHAANPAPAARDRTSTPDTRRFRPS